MKLLLTTLALVLTMSFANTAFASGSHAYVQTSMHANPRGSHADWVNWTRAWTRSELGGHGGADSGM